MSANRDRTQKFAFIYSNLYRIYQDEKTTRVLKVGDAHDSVKVTSFRPTEFLSKHIPSTPSAPPTPLQPENEALTSLRRNLEILSQLHSRLRFMLKELEELVSSK